MRMSAERVDFTGNGDDDSIMEANHLSTLDSSTDTSIDAPNPSSKTYYINAARSTLVRGDLIACTKSESPDCEFIPHFYISITCFSSKPSLTLHSGPTKTSSALGVAYLTFFSSQNFLGIGDPDPKTGKGKDGKEVIWERLDRVSKWLHGVYGFSYAAKLGGKDGGEPARKRFLWKRTKLNILDDQGDMELIEDCGGDKDGVESANRDGDKGGRELKGEVLARYEGAGFFRWKKRGRLTIKEGGDRDWETMVILSAMALVELSIRRARQRKH